MTPEAARRDKVVTQAMKKKLTFGYIYDLRNPDQFRRPWVDLYAETLDFIAWTENRGFEGAWIPEHHVADDGYVPSPFVVMSAIAARTKRLTIGTCIALGPLYHPVRFAEDCALVDILSNGRLEIQLAVGYRRREFDAMGIDFASRGRRMEEIIDIARRLWDGETVTHESKHFGIRDASIMPRPVRGRVPIYLGGFSQIAVQRAAKIGDGLVSEMWAYEAYAEALCALGKKPASMGFRTQGGFFHVATDTEKATDELLPHAFYMNNAYGAWLNEDKQDYDLKGDHTLFKPMTLEEFKSGRAMRIMTPEKAIAALQRMLSRAPVDHFAMLIPPGMPLAKFAPYAELFAKEVIPAFR
jgi:alkanesulfonate monooxygenase SsuD/methylene tetrahydromethanopterin reductase-like flavin-dependent oxidoreductase (luciferase family)